MPALQDKMKYLRNYDGTKKKSLKPDEASGTSSPTHARKVQKPVAPNPPMLQSDNLQEDDAAIARHIKFLQKEEKKLHPNKHVVSELIKKTFVARRKMVREGAVALNTLLET